MKPPGCDCWVGRDIRFKTVTAWQTLSDFLEGLAKRKSLEKNLWVKKFIKNIDYSKDFIKINFYYSDDKNLFEMPSGCAVRSLLSVHSTAGQNPILPTKKKKK